MDSDMHAALAIGRREFLLGLSLAAAGSPLVRAETVRTEHTTSPAPLLPTIQLGEHRITRLIAGSNPISGYSYMGPILDRHMQEYFTPERIVEFLWTCEREGINAHQFSRPEEMSGVFRELRERGSKMKFICLHAGGPQRTPVETVVRDTQPIAIVHHGGVTDKLFREGKSREVHDFVKRVHDAGVLAGVSAHNPDCIKQIADEGWPVDLFMACFYYLTRTPEELEKMPPVVTVEVGYSFFASDPMAMTKVVRQVDQPCLGFKILAAGRMCGGEQKVEAAFKFAFEHLKPTDGVIVGMYPRYQDQIAFNAGYTRKLAAMRDT
ncbi:MAG TPA: hypothetical protein VMW24_21565 [Sedimentisphaerales bacterium]|nr:hypothetical protein [Sedimentisphaerales bacterium]